MGSGVLLVLAGSAIASAFLGAFVAAAKARSRAEGFFLGLILGPFGLLIEALLPTLRSEGSLRPP